MTSQPNRSVLENPAWHAIASGQRNLAQVTADAGNYIDEVSVFGALREPLGGLSPLTSIVGKGRVVALAMPLKMQLPDAGADWRVAAQVPCHQMICEQPAELRPGATSLRTGQLSTAAPWKFCRSTQPTYRKC